SAPNRSSRIRDNNNQLGDGTMACKNETERMEDLALIDDSEFVLPDWVYDETEVDDEDAIVLLDD
ncbi:MAG: hypothetical protein IJM30_09230, partial [Thermoguttaceae bacterium]|nr:hypothetical protein [Thermoguttaceae bacterium]